MFKITSMATALVLLAGVPAVHAEVVQLRFSGVFTDATWPTPLPGAIAVGNTFTLLVSYDTNALLTTKVANPDNSGNRYRYANDSVSITLSAPNFGPFLIDNDVRASLPIIVRDNFGIQPADTTYFDGITFQTIDKDAGNVSGQSVDMSILVSLRTSDLGLLNVTNDKLPVFPSSSLANFATSSFQLCRSNPDPNNFIDFSCPQGRVVGNLLSVTSVVPEPATAGLLLAGLLGLGGLARRRSAV